MKPYLSICAIYRDEAPYLREWIEFHRLVGVERFFLYNNGSEDDHLEVLAPYVEDGIVVLHDWPVFPAPAAGLRPLHRATTATTRAGSRSSTSTSSCSRRPSARSAEILRDSSSIPAWG